MAFTSPTRSVIWSASGAIWNDWGSETLCAWLLPIPGPINYLHPDRCSRTAAKAVRYDHRATAVHRELMHPAAPALVRDWAALAPAWLEVRSDPDLSDSDPAELVLDDGER